jgi:putative holliday junction resolvase
VDANIETKQLYSIAQISANKCQDLSSSENQIDGRCLLCSNTRMLCGRILALDYGTKNVGLALSDELGALVRPLPSIPNHGRRDLMIRIKSAVAELAVEGIVLGMPIHMDGRLGEAAERVHHFMELLKREVSLPIDSMDERLSTVEASELWREMSARQRRKYRTVDSLAAAFILERYLKES